MTLKRVWGRLLVITMAAATLAGACSAVNPAHPGTGGADNTGGSGLRSRDSTPSRRINRCSRRS